MNDEVVVEPDFVREAFVLLRDKLVILHREVVILDEGFPFEIECGHGVDVVARATQTTEHKGRGLNAPRLEVPLSTCQTSNAKPRPVGARFGRSFDGRGKVAVFEAARSRSYAN